LPFTCRNQAAEAVNFIRNHSKEVIQVGDVAEAVGLSSRTLEQRFRKVLSHSVHEEIKYVRTTIRQLFVFCACFLRQSTVTCLYVIYYEVFFQKGTFGFCFSP